MLEKKRDVHKYINEQSGSFLNAPTAHPEERSDEGSQNEEKNRSKVGSDRERLN